MPFLDGVCDDIQWQKIAFLEHVWKRDYDCVFKKFEFFLLKFNMICIFWIVLMC